MLLSRSLFVLTLVIAIQVAAFAEPKQGETVGKDVRREWNSEALRQSYHRLETAYGYARVHSQKTQQEGNLQNFIIAGDVVITPRLSITARVPFISLEGEVALSNPSLGLKGVLYEGLLKGFPTFIFWDTDIKPPLTTDREYVFKRTDVTVGMTTLREVYHLSLFTDMRYTLKIDADSASKKYGNALSLSLGGELNTGYNISFGSSIDFRHASSLKIVNAGKFPGISLFTIRPHFAYHYGADMTFKGMFALPIGRQREDEILNVFGDYTTAGLGGNTFQLTFEKKF